MATADLKHWHPPRDKVGKRRERRTERGVLQLRCYGPFHDGDWLRAERFGISDKLYRTYCKECRAYYEVKLRGGDGTVRLELVRKWIWEIVNRSGGINAGARTLGITSPTLFRWLGRYKGYEQKRIQRKSVKRVLDVLAALRSGELEPNRPLRNGKKTFKHGCAGCGITLEDYTPGCKSCWGRRRSRGRRKVQ